MKNVLLVFALTLLTLLMIVSFVRATVDPLQVIATITLDKSPKCIAVNEETNRIYVSVEGGLMIIDGETDTVITEILPETDIIAILVTPQTNRIYAAVYRENITVIDGATNQPVGEIPEKIYTQYEIAVNPVTNLIYIGDNALFQGEYDCVAVYNGETNTVVASVNIPGSNVHQLLERVHVTVNPETNRIYATWSGDNTLHVIDGNTNSIIKTVSPSPFSERMTVNPYTNYIYFGSRVLDGETLEEVTSDYQGNLRAVDPVNNLLYTLNSSMLFVLDGTTHGVVTSLEQVGFVSMWTDSMAVNCKTGKVYWGRDYSNQIVVIPEFPSWIIMPLLFVATLMVIICKKRLPKNPSNI